MKEASEGAGTSVGSLKGQAYNYGACSKALCKTATSYEPPFRGVEERVFYHIQGLENLDLLPLLKLLLLKIV